MDCNIRAIQQSTLSDLSQNIAVSNHNSHADIDTSSTANCGRCGNDVYVELFAGFNQSSTRDSNLRIASDVGIDDVSILTCRLCHTELRALRVGNIIREVLAGVGTRIIILIEVIAAVIIGTCVIAVLIANMKIGSLGIIRCNICRKISIQQIILSYIGSCIADTIHEYIRLEAICNSVGRILVQHTADDCGHDSNTCTGSSACSNTACVITDISVGDSLHRQSCALNGAVISDIGKNCILCHCDNSCDTDAIGAARKTCSNRKQIIIVGSNNINIICNYLRIIINIGLGLSACNNDIHKAADSCAANAGSQANTIRIDVCSGSSQNLQVSTADLGLSTNRSSGCTLEISNQSRTADSCTAETAGDRSDSIDQIGNAFCLDCHITRSNQIASEISIDLILEDQDIAAHIGRSIGGDTEVNGNKCHKVFCLSSYMYITMYIGRRCCAEKDLCINVLIVGQGQNCCANTGAGSSRECSAKENQCRV